MSLFTTCPELKELLGGKVTPIFPFHKMLVKRGVKSLKEPIAAIEEGLIPNWSNWHTRFGTTEATVGREVKDGRWLHGDDEGPYDEPPKEAA